MSLGISRGGEKKILESKNLSWLLKMQCTEKIPQGKEGVTIL